MKKWKHEFDASLEVIDLRAMAKNYPGLGVIPVSDITEVIKEIIGPISYKTQDPNKSRADYPKLDGTEIPQPQLLTTKELGVLTSFQRNCIPKNIRKILRDFDPTTVQAIQVVKLTHKNKILYLIWDGHHTYHVCVIIGYSNFECRIIDVDAISDEKMIKQLHQSKKAPLSEDDRLEYAIWLAGKNFIRINYANKQILGDFDRYKIQLEIKDADTVNLENIFKKHNCQVVRSGSNGGDVTQVKTMEKLYAIEDDNNIKGRYLSRALKFHRENWPDAEIELELVRPMTFIYQMFDLQDIEIEPNFDSDFANALKDAYRFPEKIQRKLKEDYESALADTTREFVNTATRLPTNNAQRVVSALLNFYSQKVNKQIIPVAGQRWQIK